MKMKIILPPIAFSLLVFCFVACNNPAPQKQKQPSTQAQHKDKDEDMDQAPATPPANRFKNSKFTYKIFSDDSVMHTKGWGYNIYINGKLYIHQPTIPAVGGNNGFGTKVFASKAAMLVISKIKRNIMPPTVSVAELDSLKALKK